MVSFLLADAKDLVDPRYLGSNIPLRSPGMIAWYCFLAVVVVPIISCGIHILYRNQIRHARAQSAIEDEQRIESIEANVQVWSAAEEQRHYRVIKCAVGQNIEILSHDDLLHRAGDTDNTCGICLEDLGQSYAFSSNNNCQHLYHEGCIVTWLASRRDSQCPICRQMFICIPIMTPRSSLTSEAESQSGFHSQQSNHAPSEVERQNLESTFIPTASFDDSNLPERSTFDVEQDGATTLERTPTN